VCIDDYAASKEITEHLIELGHERVGFIKGNPNQYSTGERLRGYKDALAAHGLVFDKNLIARGLFTYDSGLKAARKLLDVDPRPTAVFASNDDMAAACLAVAASEGLKVPTDLSVVGFDDSPLASAVFPRLTTVKQPLDKMAAGAINSLLDLIGSSRGAAANESELVKMRYKIVLGASTSAPA
jgi:LacI family transcriptional regulator